MATVLFPFSVKGAHNRLPGVSEVRVSITKQTFITFEEPVVPLASRTLCILPSGVEHVGR